MQVHIHNCDCSFCIVAAASGSSSILGPDKAYASGDLSDAAVQLLPSALNYTSKLSPCRLVEC